MFDRENYFFKFVFVFAIILLTGCGAQSIHEDAQDLITAGQYEKALKTYQDGLLRYPDSVVLRSGQVSARDAIFARVMADVAKAHAAGNDKAEDEILQRALAINPNDERAKAMRLDLERNKRRKAAIASAKESLAHGMWEQAMQVVEMALKDNPRDEELLALQRQHELKVRESEMNTKRLAETRPISLDFREANLRMVLEVLTRNSGVNFVIDKDVRPDLRTTVFLRQTKLEDALELITATSQLGFKIIDSSTVLIYPKTPDKLKEYQDLMIRAFYLSSADVKNTAALLKTMLKIREPFIDEKLNLIMVRETPEIVRLAERLIALEDQSEPEVMLEVEVLEIQGTSYMNLGVAYPDSITLTPTAPSTGFTLGNLSTINRDSIGVTTPTLTINLHRDVGDVNLLANPKIRARNREKAKIMIGDKLPIVTTSGSVSNSGYISESVQYVDVGLKLDVEPTIYLNDEVAIRLGLEVSSLVSSIKTTAGSLVYQIGTRTANTVLRLRDGETQFLAGLINNNERMSANRVPGFGDIPVLGRLFASQSDTKQRTEIVLSVTPHIIRNIRRPDLNQTEFWSGTENDVRSRPLMLSIPKTSNKNPVGKAPTVPNGDVAEKAVAAEPSLTLSLAAPAEVKVGDIFEVNVNVKAGEPIRGVPVQLQFPKQKLQIMEANEGAFLKQGNGAVSATKVLQQTEGKASMAVLRNTAEGAKGEGTMMSFKFKALAAGDADIRLSASNAIANQPIIATVPTAATKIVVR